MKDKPPRNAAVMRFFNEIGIIEQLSRALFEARLPDGLLVSHFGVLNHLTRVRDGQTPLRLARAFQVPKTTMTHTLGGLEKRGYVRLAPNPEDGRSKCVWITPEGAAFRQSAIESLSPLMMRMLDEFPPDEMAELLPKLAKLRAYLDETRD